MAATTRIIIGILFVVIAVLDIALPRLVEKRRPTKTEIALAIVSAVIATLNFTQK